MATLHFTKMHGLGNDYLYHFGELADVERLSQRLSDRHFGIGSDGIVTISPSDLAGADFKMRIFNADGSEAMMCGNGIRCVGKYVFDKGYTDKTVLNIETLSGIKKLDLQTRNGKVSTVCVNMGAYSAQTPVVLKTEFGDDRITPVSMGNPHAVTFVDEDGASMSDTVLQTKGRAIEHHHYFPHGVNAEFVHVIDAKTLRMRVWERGSGITMACGTGACASVAAAVEAGLCAKEVDVTVQLDGGRLNIKILRDNTVMMTGPAELVCECECESKGEN